ncbi:MAG: signal peptidase II [Polyangiaceae bacterium]|nr:signal peptidase II [Polyangiaceae bacterium]
MNEPSRPVERKSPLAISLLLLAVLAGIVADLGSKEWAIENLAGERLTARASEVCVPGPTGYAQMDRVRRAPVVIIEGFFELRYAENCGAAFGVMNTWSPMAKRLVFFPVALGAVIVLSLMYVRGRGGRFLAVAVPMIISGAVGNFVDRVRFGYVVDFIRFYGETPKALEGLLGSHWEYPTFNIADVAITVGVVCLLIDGWLEGKREQRAQAGASRAEPGGGSMAAALPPEAPAAADTPLVDRES